MLCFAKGGNRVIFLPSSATSAEDIRTQILSAFMANFGKSTSKNKK